ncbi:lipopolysaccharide assembly protein LapB [Paludibacterium denitrificans]|uniref:Lipopolysaccharide assembly protein B n=1 Tax=Paludibacterium denitrificans TaxID=2675226 RepID=A0A844GCP2_9NEIS|nr:lipopolysaccharide assembly protein LapB [Paludibacterium denitrificans]MTD32687.1 lipopolysaccharide assembly protein LapB [Paludibacterium denitrificans]HJV07187.1 lipopolysaccharide assembly protein LapB [Chromobacteriaceae bacterium]
MELDLWWLLLFPAFFGLGWLAARVDMRTVLKQAKSVPTAFFRGVDALVEDKTDIAAQALAEVSRQQGSAPELQLTLGKLYRKRGENDRAIRLHQRMLESSDLPTENRERVRFELAQDFRKAGLVDRAEEILLQLLDGNMGLAARQQLLDIYQQDRDWTKAIETAKELRSDAHSFQHEVAQFYCELAQGEVYRSNLPLAREHVAAAFSANRKCVRASLILGDIEFAEGHFEAAIAAWQNIEKQNFNYLSMAAERLFDAYEKLEKPLEGIALLRGYQKTFPQLELTDLLYQKLATYEGEHEALLAVRETVHARPSLMGVYRLLEAQMEDLSPEGRLDTEMTRALIQKHALRLTVHRCKCCNFRSRAFFWHCPACGEWESFTPNRSETH